MIASNEQQTLLTLSSEGLSHAWGIRGPLRITNYNTWNNERTCRSSKSEESLILLTLLTNPVQCPFWIRSVQLLSLLNPNPSHTSQFGPVRPARQLSHCPGGPKLGTQELQLSPVHPMLHLQQSSGGSNLGAHPSQLSPPHPCIHCSGVSGAWYRTRSPGCL